MTENDINSEVKENRADLEMLNKKLDALIEILKKEGITSKEEVEDMAKNIIMGTDTDDD
jgi:hypothetical protein